MESFWDFSVRTYRTPGVPDACLSLQNDHGADVNMLLYCCWIGAVVGEFNGDLFARAGEFSARWAQHVVIPLRAARTWMKQTGCNSEPVATDACMALREDIKSVEFAAEKMQQEALESLVSIGPVTKQEAAKLTRNVAANLALYLDSRDIRLDDDVRKKLSIIVSAAFTEIDASAVVKALGN